MIVCRFKKNPILVPNRKQSWEAEAVFNGCPVQKGDKTFLVYRALSLPHYHTTAKTKLMVSDIGIAESKNGTNFYNRKRFIIPEYEWESSGCEDPRVTQFNNKYYIFYTALGSWPPRADTIRVGLAISKDLEKIEHKHLITPFNAKAMTMFPERINGKIWTILSVNTDKPPVKICLASFDKESDLWLTNSWQQWYGDLSKHSLDLQRRPQDHVEIGAAPIKTKYGWLLIYSYIRDYFSSQKLFGIEAVLLDFKNPFKIIARTDFPLFTPEEYYEKYGLINNIVFPSGAIVKNDIIHLYYGAADTTCCLAYIELPVLLEQMLEKGKISVKFIRANNNPIISPIKENPWETKATFNPGAVYLDKKVHLVYRAMSEDNTSVFGYATSKDGVNIDYRAKDPIYIPIENFEAKLQPGGNSGAEDPRLVEIDNKVYMFYTAFNGKDSPRVALTWITTKNFLQRQWFWSRPVLITPPGLDNKDAAMFPEKIKGKYIIIHRNGNDIDLSFHSNLNFDGATWLEEYRWIAPRKGWWDSVKVGAAAPPIKTNKGWFLLYHGVSEDGIYRVGAVLTDLCDPVIIIGRTEYPIFEPEALYEKEGIVSNVVFPCGAVLIGKKLFIYYGGADKIVGAASIDINKVINILKASKCQINS